MAKRGLRTIRRHETNRFLRVAFSWVGVCVLFTDWGVWAAGGNIQTQTWFRRVCWLDGVSQQVG